MDRPKIHTMSELSAQIGVSRPTLSRYFQNKTLVRKSTVTKIERLLKGVDYIPNFYATRMNRKASGLIGVIIPHFSDLFFTSLLEVIEEAARLADYTIVTQSANGDPALEAQAIERLRSMNADGVIIAPLAQNNALSMLQKVNSEMPTVFVDSQPSERMSGIDFVGTDNAQSVATMVDYLCRSGTAPAFLGMPRLNSNSRAREVVYEDRIVELGHQPQFVDTNDIEETWQFEAFGYGVMNDHFGHGRYVNSTILCANDRIAIGAIHAANRHGLFEEKAGGLRIAGHDDHPLSRYMSPALTTVAQDVGAIGNAAVQRLIGRIKQTNPTKPLTLLHSATLVLRESA